MGIKFRCTFDAASHTQKIMKELEKRAGRALAEAAREIVKRTQGGTDAEGAPFAPYTPEYAAWKKDKGRTGNVDLTLTGRMLGNVTHEALQRGYKILGRLFFSSALEGAKAKGNMRKRKFFELSKDQVSEIAEKLKG